jgi:predicted restriction endonuclease
VLDEVLRHLIEDRLQHLHIDVDQEDTPVDQEDTTNDDLRRWALQERAIRDGQQQFRKALLLTRDPRCAVTRSAVAACLEAAHIRPYRGQHTNKASNGILLRADIHILFDRGLLRINPGTFAVFVDATLKDTEYSQYDGVTLNDANWLDNESLQYRWNAADV